MIVILEISSWAGISIGAIHYYGTLKYDGGKPPYTLVTVDLERVLTAAEVKKQRMPNCNPMDTDHGFVLTTPLRGLLLGKMLRMLPLSISMNILPTAFFTRENMQHARHGKTYWYIQRNMNTLPKQ